jgi:hypothetical protein
MPIVHGYVRMEEPDEAEKWAATGEGGLLEPGGADEGGCMGGFDADSGRTELTVETAERTLPIPCRQD